ncbi:hypothetical protein E24_00428 [Faustovirus]|nr:hypothetical protein PRJ_Fausto_00404 [Faustovirus]AMN83342.1 hypothetical protein E24_00428 [Faustovirus]AMN84326.1 hypothetical protein D5a_00426 [Faustovirus]AMN85312.1 hypothetical protein E23_00428 [Faustovirus]QBR99309.1 hypothetical protein [Faustovirus mariensis]
MSDDIPELLSDTSSVSSDVDETTNTPAPTNDINDDYIGDYQFDSDDEIETNNTNTISSQINGIRELNLSTQDLLTALLMWQMNQLGDSPNNDT